MPRRRHKTETGSLDDPTDHTPAIGQAEPTTPDRSPAFEEAARRLGVWAHPRPEAELVLPDHITLDEADQSFVRQVGPRKRAAGEPLGLAVDLPTGITLNKRGRYLELGFREEPQSDQIRALYDRGFYRKPGTTTWASPASPEQVEAAYRLFNEFTGKTERHDVYRGR